MMSSTPVVSKRDELRRRTLLKDIGNLNGSINNNFQQLRRSSLINQSAIAPSHVDDEEERSLRRDQASIQSRLSSIASAASPQLGATEMSDHLQACLKMYAENKINVKNAWNLKIIDCLRSILTSHGLTRDSLQIASTSLDVSSKVYGIKVDDIHAEGLKLANSMARMNAQKQVGEAPDEDEACNSDEGGSDANAKKSKKKKRLMSSGKKTTIAKDPSSLLGDIPKLESAFFQTGTNLQTSVVDNMFTTKLPMNHGGYKFMLLSKEKAWASNETSDSTIDFEKEFPFVMPEVRNIQICAPFANFVIDEWDPDAENELLGQENVNDEVLFDSEGIPIPELDGSVHDLFENAGADENPYESSGEENAPNNETIVTSRIAHINEFRPELNGVRANDYNYAGAVDVGNNKRIIQLWAGASHWKLKHIRRTTSRFTGQREKLAVKTPKRIKFQAVPVDFSIDVPSIFYKKLSRPKRVRLDEDPVKLTLPLIIRSEEIPLNRLMSKPVTLTLLVSDKEQDPEVEPYNFENANDSFYCSQNGIENDHDNDNDGDIQNEEVFGEPQTQQHFLGDNLVDAPEMVPKTYVPYSLQAKKLDMKKLKIAVWKSIVSKTSNEKIREETMYSRSVPKKNFSEIYQNLSLYLKENVLKELSVPIAFAGLLHLANEHNLKLTGSSDLKDFGIEQMNQFKS